MAIYIGHTLKFGSQTDIHRYRGLLILYEAQKGMDILLNYCILLETIHIFTRFLNLQEPVKCYSPKGAWSHYDPFKRFFYAPD